MRYFYLDALRSVLMILGVFYHASLIFSLDEPWRVADPHGSYFFEVLHKIIHVFRMPAFFMVAGFFALFSLRRHDPDTFVKTRAQRLLLPFFCTLLTVNSAQFAITNGREILTERGWASLLGNMALWHLSGATSSHLWFLTQLFVYAAALAGACRLSGPAQRWIARRWTPPPHWRARAARGLSFINDHGLALALLPLCSVVLLIVKRETEDFYDLQAIGGLEMDKLLSFAPFFVFGALMFRSQALYESFLRIRPWQVILLAGAIGFLLIVDPDDSLTGRSFLCAYFEGATLWVSCQLCFGLFRRFLDRASRAFAYLSDASYSIYLFHQVFVILIGSLLLPVPVSCFIKYPLIVLGGTLAPLAIHHTLILNSRVLRLMFNGKYEKGFRWKAAGHAPANDSITAPGRAIS